MPEVKPNPEQAIRFMFSSRGQYIMGQALAVAIESLNEVEPEARREISNISDMQYLLDNLFPIGKLHLIDDEGNRRDE